MDNIRDKFHTNNRNPLGSFFLLIIFVLFGYLIGQFLGVALAYIIFDVSVFDLQNILYDPSGNDAARPSIYLIQGITALVTFILAPLLFVSVWEKRPISSYLPFKSLSTTIFLISFFLVIAFMYVNSMFIEWNQQITLPEFLRGFEAWAQEFEERAKVLTEFLTRFETFGQFLLGIVVIAIIPAVGEELLFRGLIQNQLHAFTKNIHVAIFLSGFLFSAMHFQFYGLIPRMLLGVLFGYMYYWSQNLWVPIFAHFVNNAFTLTMLYLYQQKAIEYILETETSVPWYIFLLSLVIGIILLIYFRNHFRQRRLVDE